MSVTKYSLSESQELCGVNQQVCEIPSCKELIKYFYEKEGPCPEGCLHNFIFVCETHANEKL
jgi:hypothetical protein